MGNGKIKAFFAKLKGKKHLEIVIAAVAVALMLVLYFSVKTGRKSGSTVASAQTVSSDYCTQTEKNLLAALENMQGVGKVRVAIAWASGVEKVIAYATNIAGENTSTTPTVVSVQGGSAPIVLKEIYPKALGAVVVCQGGNNVAVKLDVLKAVSVLLDISQNKIDVFPMR